MTKYFISILVILFSGCKQTTKPAIKEEIKDPVAILRGREKQSLENQTNIEGKLISTISFKVKTGNKKDFEDGFIPWASIENALQDIPHLDKKDEVVITDTSIKIIIDYPLTNKYEFTLTSNKGFTRQLLLSEISAHYYKLYEEEENTATIKTIPPDNRTIYNRNETNGKYGIWGHDIADLVLSGAEVYKTASGGVVVLLEIQS